MRYWSELISNVLLPFIALLFGFTVISQFPASTLFWLEGQLWLPYVLVVVSLLLSIQFNHSRLFYAGVIWLLLLFSIDQSVLADVSGLTVWMKLPLLASAVALLLWREDKSIRVVNGIQDSVFLAIAAGVAYFYVQLTVLENTSVFQGLATLFFNIVPAVSEQFSATELSLYFLLLVSAIVRLIIQPRLNNALLGVMICMMLISQLNHNVQVIQFGASLFAIAAAISILLDSHDMAFKDELTGISARRALIQFTRSIGHNYTIVMADVDHFKSFNDTYGHDIGDQVLRMVAHQLNRVTNGGRAFRYGGEEFALVFPNKKPEQVFEIVDTLRDNIANYPMVIRQPNRPKKKPKNAPAAKNVSKSKHKVVHVTMSFGMAIKDKNTSFEDALKAADELLYKAKKAGRNNVQS